MISCGEASGDLYAGALTREIRLREPAAEVFGLGGPHLESAGGRLIANYEGLAVTGLAEALAVIPRSLRVYRRLVREARAARPAVFVAIDFPDFNFRLARAVGRLGIPVVYYISPQLWAWRAGRMATMRRIARMVLVIFPFEEALYRRAGVPVRFVGHPLVDLVTGATPRAAFLSEQGLDPAAPTVALLPGSRPNEVRAIWPVIAQAAVMIAETLPGVQFVVARAPKLADALFDPRQRPGPIARIVTVEGRTNDVLAAADVVISASGTATVQAALHERPMVIVYRLSALTYFLGKPFVRVSTYGMPNLVAGRRVVPELIQDDFTPRRAADEALRFLQDPALAERARVSLREVKERLGGSGASGRAAEAVLDVARVAIE